MITSPIARQTAATILDEWCPGETTKAWLAEQIQCAIDDSVSESSGYDKLCAYITKELGVTGNHGVYEDIDCARLELERLRKSREDQRDLVDVAMLVSKMHMAGGWLHYGDGYTGECSDLVNLQELRDAARAALKKRGIE